MDEFLGVHLVGSMQGTSTDEVFQTVGANLRDYVRRVSDGDVGPSRRWLFNEWRHYAESGFFEEYRDSDTGPARAYDVKLRLRDGVRPNVLRLPPLNYARNAQESYPVFAQCKAKGTLSKATRFMVCMPTPFTSIGLLEEDSGRAILAAHETSIREVIEQLMFIVPPDELAIQWDAVREMRSQLTPSLLNELAALADWVPPGVEVGYHLCFGDRKARGDMAARGMREQGMSLTSAMASHERLSRAAPVPEGMGILREVSNSIITNATRKVDFIHLAALPAVTPPLTTAYEPLGNLESEGGTEFYLGLLDIDSGIDGTRLQVEAASRSLRRFGIGPECGLQRIDPAEYIRALSTLRTLAGEMSSN